VGIGSINSNDTMTHGLTGPVGKSTGVKKDIRFLKVETYAHYWFLSMHSYLGKNGDSYDRFLIRLREMYESINVVFQILTNLTHLSFKSSFYDLTPNAAKTPANFFSFFNFLNSNQANKLSYKTKYTSMETLIKHFKYFSEGTLVPKGFAYKAVEAPKGEFGVSIISDGSANPYRCKIRTPAYHHMQVMPRMVQGHYFADLVTVLGSIDIVFGDVDR